MPYADQFPDAEEKPSCFGDEELQDDSHPTCRACEVRRNCKLVVRRKYARRDGRPDSRLPRYSQHKPPTYRGAASRDAGRQRPAEPRVEDLIERDEASESFFVALAANGALSSARAVLSEAVYALDSVPRFQYPDPFKNALERGRRRGEEDED